MLFRYCFHYCCHYCLHIYYTHFAYIVINIIIITLMLPYWLVDITPLLRHYAFSLHFRLLLLPIRHYTLLLYYYQYFHYAITLLPLLLAIIIFIVISLSRHYFRHYLRHFRHCHAMPLLLFSFINIITTLMAHYYCCHFTSPLFFAIGHYYYLRH